MLVRRRRGRGVTPSSSSCRIESSQQNLAFYTTRATDADGEERSEVSWAAMAREARRKEKGRPTDTESRSRGRWTRGEGGRKGGREGGREGAAVAHVEGRKEGRKEGRTTLNETAAAANGSADWRTIAQAAAIPAIPAVAAADADPAAAIVLGSSNADDDLTRIPEVESGNCDCAVVVAAVNSQSDATNRRSYRCI